MSDNQHIREFLDYYCGLPKEPQYAVLLVGLWGSGKTWFIKDFVKTHLNQPKRVLYLSLYGVQSFDDIESEFFRLLHPVLGSKPVRVLHRLARGVLKTSLNFDIDGDGKSDGSISGGLPAEKLLERISLDATKILVLDDLERCSIPIADLLGYVNQFIEHGGIKAILIANEVELLKTASGTAAGYARIKEKLIGRTFEVIPEVGLALEHFAADLPSIRAQQVVRSNFPLITQVYECSKYKNLRLVRHALWDFDRLLQSLEPSVLQSDELLKDLLALFLAYSFEVHSGAIKPSEVEKLQDHWGLYLRRNNNEPDPDQHFHDIRAKYSGLNLYTSLVQQPVLVAIFSTGSVPRAELNASLLKSKYFQDKNQPTWVKLWYGANLSDDDFASVLATVDAEWAARSYRNLGEVIHVTGLLIRYAKHGIYSRSVEEVVTSAREYVSELLASGEIPMIEPNMRPSPFERDSYAGLGFASMEDNAFQDFLEYIDERRRSALQASLPAQANALLSLVDTDTNLFYRRLVLNNDAENRYYKTAILHFVPPIDFIGRLLATTPENRRTVAYTFKERYSFDQFNPELLPELGWLIEVGSLLRQEVAVRAGKVSSMSLQWIVDPHINNAISRLERFKPAPSE
ncbi:P-loop NTPase fold protein [Rubrivivax gelatinosus]|uniref:KAP-like P-loop domain-containing protein n=1 Tax=Rubrivivax gelatinosus TaxID=28068 RepID=A0A4R2M7Q8_RUBGE|nr:P-loop NTPase fold protein [Rubrivivax gelatinosus]TCO98425.1 KAP-like P-loop domain-containing protein [Rubrivivax gelatinosus]